MPANDQRSKPAAESGMSTMARITISWYATSLPLSLVFGVAFLVSGPFYEDAIHLILAGAVLLCYGGVGVRGFLTDARAASAASATERVAMLTHDLFGRGGGVQ